MCNAITKQNKPCKREASHDGLCTQHFKIQQKSIQNKYVKKQRNIPNKHLYKKIDKITKPIDKCIINNCIYLRITSSRNGEYCKHHAKQYALEKPDECAVCLENIKEIPLLCGHYIHKKCITMSLKAECPLCRSPVQVTPSEKKEIDDRMATTRTERTNTELNSFMNRMNIRNQIMDSQTGLEILRTILLDLQAIQNSFIRR